MVTGFASWRASGTARAVLLVAVFAITGSLLSAPTAAADSDTATSLTTKRAKVARQVSQAHDDLDESTRALAAAARRVARTQGQLASARAELAATRRALTAAKAADRTAAAELREARRELAAARAAVEAGQRALDAQTAMAADMVRDQYQKQTNLLPIALVVGDSTADLATRLQWSTTMFDTTQAAIDRLHVIQQQLVAERKHLAELEVKFAAARSAAAAKLRRTRSLELAAERQQTRVATLLGQQQAEQRAAAREVRADKARYTALKKERSAVEHRIAVRIAKAKAAAARRAAAAERARKAAAAKARRTAEKPRRHHATSKSSGSKGSTSSGSGSSASHGFSYPVSAPITSSYGMRFHPVLRIWKLHDGTDFGAGCGTAIRAPYSGRVAERYYNVGYGNRLMIDHGFIDGRYVTTGYNHAIRYTVRVGQHVSKGQVVGYVGTTGFSTGCHLHLMVWLNGRVVNPMTWF